MRILCLLLLVISARAADVLSTMPGVVVPANTWTSIPLAGSGGYKGWKIVGWDSSGWIPGLSRTCGYWDFREISSEPNRSYICYSWKYNRYDVIDNGSTWHTEHLGEGGHPLTGMGIDLTTSISYGFGNFSGAQVSERPQFTWVYDFIGNVGRSKQPFNATVTTATKPNYNIQLAAGAFDSIHGVYVTHGGSSFTGTSEYAPATNTWTVGVSCTAVAANCPDPTSIEGSMAYNTNDGRLYYFGGAIGATPQSTLFRYNQPTHTWVALSPTGTPPSGRVKSGFAYDPVNNIFLVAGGSTTYPTQTPTNDTLVYDPDPDRCSANADGCWISPTPAAAFTVSTQPSFWTLSYNPEAQAFLLFLGDTPKLWAYRYQGTGPNAGYATAPTYTASSGSVNRNSDTWAQHPTLTNDGTNLFHAWVESGITPADAVWFWPYAHKWTGATKANLGAAYNSLSSGATSLESDDISITSVGGTPWACWHQQNNSTFGIDKLMVKQWTAGAWSGGLVGQLTAGASSYSQGQCSIAATGSVPSLIVKERAVQAVTPARVFAYVLKWNGASWDSLGAVNRLGDTTDTTQADSVAITSNGTQPCAAWTEYTSRTVTNGGNHTPPQVYASCWNGAAWVTQGGSANVTATNGAYGISVAYMGGEVYVSFTERTNSGTQKVYVRKYNGAAWSTVGGAALNRDASDGWAFRTSLTTDGTNVYAAWSEQINSEPWVASGSVVGGSFAQRPQVFASKWNGSAWSKLGGSLNADTMDGAAVQPSITALGSTPVVTWAEVKLGTLRQTYIKQFDGADWVSIGSASPSCSIAPTSAGPYTAGQVVSQSFTGSNCTASTWSATGLSGSGLVINSGTGALTGTAAAGTYSVTVTYDTASVPFTLTINAAGAASRFSGAFSGTIH